MKFSFMQIQCDIKNTVVRKPNFHGVLSSKLSNYLRQSVYMPFAHFKLPNDSDEASQKFSYKIIDLEFLNRLRGKRTNDYEGNLGDEWDCVNI